MQHTSEHPHQDRSAAVAPFSWRAHLAVHPAAEDYPLMKDVDPAGFKELVSDIWETGLRAPFVFWDVGGHFLLDGRNRLDALAQLGLLYKTDDHHLGIKGWTAGKGWNDRPGGRLGYALSCACQGFHDGDPYEIALSLNVHRRHLNAELKRDLIAKLLEAKSEASNRSIAEQVKADHKTVGAVRAEMEGRGEIPHVETRTDTKGRKQPAKKKPKTKPTEGVVKPEPKLVATTKPDEAGAAELHSVIGREWREAERAFEALTAHTVTQVAQAIPPGKAALITEISDYFTALAAKLVPRPAGNGEAPAAGLNDDLSIRPCLDRRPKGSAP